MGQLDQDTILKLAAGMAVVVAAIVGALLGYLAQRGIKRHEFLQQIQRDKAAERLKLYQPLLRFCYDLDRRIGHILRQLPSSWLRATHLSRIKAKEGFAANPDEMGYFIISSIYTLACFFGWAEVIKRTGDTARAFKERGTIRKWFAKRRRNIEHFLGTRRVRGVFRFDSEISTLSKLFQYEELFLTYLSSRPLQTPRDACKLHKHLQYAIGELMLAQDSSGGLRCKSFREFYDAYVENAAFRFWFVKLEDMVADLSDFADDKGLEVQVQLKNDVRPLRLLAIRYWCRILMRNLAEELDIETPAPDEALQGVSPDLAGVIRGVKIEDLESYLLGIRLQHS